MIKTTATTAVVAALALVLVAVPLNAQPESQPVDRGPASAQLRQEAIQEIRAEREEKINERLQRREVRIRADVCERREQQLARIVPRLTTQSTRILEVVDGIHERVQGFYESGQLTVSNYENLNQNVFDAREQATAAIELVASNDFEVDCSATGLGDQLFVYRESIADARDALKAYRAELVVLISSLRSAAADEAEEADDEVEQSEDTELEGVGSEEIQE
jgi:hypothetical protein